ncbi:hypothetical protein MMC16_004114 [Acarospora aff. strigata]|nr:hypothetical protein [Acarospora aff. strigata]
MTESTRLVRLSTGALEEYAIDVLPPYIAVSHTWADDLFNPEKPFRDTTGGQAVLSWINTDKESWQPLDHCWVDTFSIKQADEEDKRRQIPLMGEIYTKAVSLAVTLPYDLQTPQEDVDRLVQALSPAFEMVEEEDWSVKRAKWCTAEPGKSLIVRALDGINHLIKGSWATRVWTAQEFLLAKTVVWVGTDHIPIKIQDKHFFAVITVCNDLFSLELSGRLQKLKLCIWPLLLLRLQYVEEKTRIITEISHRDCSIPQDMIYGAMAASGVIIEVGQAKGVEDIWRLWWEAAIMQQHVRWACCAIMWKTPGIPLIVRDYNCAMPPFEVRQTASDVLNMDRIEPLGPMELSNGTVSLYGYDVGSCKVVAHLGPYFSKAEDGTRSHYPNLTYVLWSQGSFKLAFRIAAALSAGQLKVRNLLLVAQVLTYNSPKAIWAAKNRGKASFSPVFRSYEQHRVYAHFTRVQGHQMGSVAGTGLEVYLANISNTVTSTDVAVLMPGKAPEGSLRALDFNAVHGAGDEFTPRFLTIVKISDTSAPPNTIPHPGYVTLHKVGVTLPVKFFFLDMYGQHDFEGGEPELFHIGGQSCTCCRFEKPERAPDTVTSDIRLYQGPEPSRAPNIQFKPRVRASPFDPRKTRRPHAMVSVKYLWRYIWRAKWFMYDHAPLPQYPLRGRKRLVVDDPVGSSYNDYSKATLRPTEAMKKDPSPMTAAEVRAIQRQHKKTGKPPV